MQIVVTRTGGFAGVHQQLGPLDSSSLDPDIAVQVERVVAEVGFFELPGSLLTGREPMDGFFYAIQLSEDSRDHTVKMGDGADHPAAIELHTLIRLLDGAAGGFEDRRPSTDPQADGVHTREWSAWYNRMPGGEDPDLHVSGICGLPSSHTMVRLEPGNVGIAPEPDLCVLQLVVLRPELDDTLYVERRVSWHEDVGPDIARVRINGVAEEIPVEIVC